MNNFYEKLNQEKIINDATTSLSYFNSIFPYPLYFVLVRFVLLILFIKNLLCRYCFFPAFIPFTVITLHFTVIITLFVFFFLTFNVGLGAQTDASAAAASLLTPNLPLNNLVTLAAMAQQPTLAAQPTAAQLTNAATSLCKYQKYNFSVFIYNYLPRIFSFLHIYYSIYLRKS